MGCSGSKEKPAPTVAKTSATTPTEKPAKVVDEQTKPVKEAKKDTPERVSKSDGSF